MLIRNRRDSEKKKHERFFIVKNFSIDDPKCV